MHVACVDYLMLQRLEAYLPYLKAWKTSVVSWGLHSSLIAMDVTEFCKNHRYIRVVPRPV